MKKFIIRLLLFISIIVTFILSDLYLQKILLIKDKDVKVSNNFNTLLLGHSHVANAYNTKYINNTISMGESGESFFYTYYKAKKIINNNPQIKKVFIEFTNNQIDKEMDNWIWDDVHLQYKLISYWTLLDQKAFMFLYKQNNSGFINAFSKCLFENILKLFKDEKNIVLNGGFGGYKENDNVFVKTKSLILLKKAKQFPLTISDCNILYLRKVVNYCKQKKIKVILVRSPMHKTYNVSKSEIKYRMILKKKFQDVDWIDNKNFPLSDNEFADNEHLNIKGAVKYSKFFNNQINGRAIMSNKTK